MPFYVVNFMLTIIKEVERKNKRRMFLCRCSCGKEVIVREPNSQTKSCGCLRIKRYHEALKSRNHGWSGTPTYRSWVSARQRCRNPKNERYSSYGGRGITFTDDWDDFKNFLRDMGERPKGKSLDRVDNNEGYSKENCRWATESEQKRNMRNNNYIAYNGENILLRDLGTRLGGSSSTLQTRLARGWSFKRAVSEPIHHKRSNKK